MKQLRLKIIVFVLPVIVLPLAAAGFLTEKWASQRLTRDAEASLQSIAQGVLLALDDQISQARRDMDMLSSASDLRSYLALQEFGLMVEAETSLDNFRHFIREFQKLNESYAQIRLLGVNGELLAQAGPVKAAPDDPEFFGKFVDTPFGQERVFMERVRRLPNLEAPVMSFGRLVHGQFKSESGPGYERWGVLVVDFDWGRLDLLLATLKTGRAIMLDERGLVVAHRDKSQILKARLGDEPLVGRVLAARPGEVISGRMGEFYTVALGFAPAEGRRLVLLLQTPMHELLAQAVESRNLIIVVTAFSVVAALVGILLVAAYITRPIRALVTATERVAKGDLALKIAISSRDELGLLASAFNRMTQELSRHIEELKRTTAEKERMASELSIASALQASILPQKPPQAPGYDFFGFTLPARETGGDFFDYVDISPEALGLAVADVSGKGLPAALFMLSSRSTLRTLAFSGLDPAEVVNRSNILISEDSGDSGTFVTTFYARLDLATGRMTYANAGHNPPFLLRADGAMEELPSGGIALGAWKDARTVQAEVTLQPGDVLLLYTDGVTEAINQPKEQFGEERLQAELRALRDLPAERIAEGVKRAVFDFAGTEPQFDDLTVSVVKVLHRGAGPDQSRTPGR